MFSRESNYWVRLSLDKTHDSVKKMNNTIIFCLAGVLGAFVAVGHTQGAMIMVHADQVLHQILPIQKQWQPRFENGKAEDDFQPHSFTVIKFD